MAHKHIPAQHMVTCDKCGINISVDTDPDAAWRPDWTQQYFTVKLDGKSLDLCPRCYNKLQKFFEWKG